MKNVASRVLAVAVLACFVFVLLSACFPGVAHAGADKGVGGDKKLAEKKGIEGLFQGKGTAADDPRLAKPWQKYLALASIGVTVIVWKFL
ncbi:MAG: hypothetical protein FJY92_08590 [Candidatus Hydrogenedentes bacterium]|nr:hypothetical protein [Candidatus Hydrogenedentota bacterium]